MAENQWWANDKPATDTPENFWEKDKRADEKPSGALRDLGKSLKVGVQKLPGMVTGLADLPIALATGARPFTSAADAVGEATGFQPGKWADETQRSDDYKAGQANVNQAWEGVDAVQKDQSASKMDYARKLLTDAPNIAGAYLKNPMYTANQVVESAPGMIAGGVASKAIRGLGALAGKGISAEAAAAGAMGPVRNAVPGYVERVVGDKLVNPVVAGIGEGAVTAGSAMDQSTGEDQQKNALSALGAGAGTALIGVGAGRLANKLGLETSGTAMAKLGDGTLGNGLSATKRILGGAISEAAFQELPQSMQEAMWQNYAEGKPIMQGVARQGVEGALSGAVMGAGANVFNSDKQATPPPEQPPAVPPAQPVSLQQDPAQLGYDPMAGTHTVFPDGSVVLNSESSNGAQTVRDMQRANRLANVGQDVTDVTDVTPNPIRDQVAQSAAQGGALSGAALVALDTGAHQAQIDQQTSEADQAAYDTYMAEQDTTDKPITHGEYAEAQMPPADLGATLLPNEDIHNGDGFPYTSEAAAQRRAKMEGKLWEVAPTDGGWKLQKTKEPDAKQKNLDRIRKANNVSPTSPVQPLPATSGGQDGNQSPASVGLGATDGNGMGADARGRADDAVGEPLQSSGGADDAAVISELNEALAPVKYAQAATETVAPETHTPGAPLTNGFFAGPAKGEKFRVSDVASTGGLTLDKRLSGGTVSTMYVGADGGFIDADNVNLVGDGVSRLWKPLTDSARQAAREILQEMGTLALGDKRREELKAKLKQVVANDGKPAGDAAPAADVPGAGSVAVEGGGVKAVSKINKLVAELESLGNTDSQYSGKDYAELVKSADQQTIDNTIGGLRTAIAYQKQVNAKNGANAAPVETPAAVEGNAATPDNVPGAGSVAVEGGGVDIGEKTIREQASVATATYDTEKKLRFAAFAESLAGQSKDAIQKAIVNSEFGASIATNELDGVSKSIAKSASLVADQARKNAAPKAESTPAQKLENQIKFQKLRVEQASDAIRSATDTDRFGLPVENGPKKQSAIKRHADAQQKLSELERELSEIGKQNASAANRAKLKAKVKQVPKDRNEADAAIQDGNATRELGAFLKSEKDAVSHAEAVSKWRTQYFGNHAETIASGDISRSDYEKLSDLVARGSVSAQRATEMIDSAADAGVIDKRVAENIKNKIKPVTAATTNQPQPQEKPSVTTPTQAPQTQQAETQQPQEREPGQPVEEQNLQAAKNLLAQQKAATGNAVAEGAIRKKLRDLAAKTPISDAKTVSALDIAATRLGMGEGKLKGLEFAPAAAPVSNTQTADAPELSESTKARNLLMELQAKQDANGMVGDDRLETQINQIKREIAKLDGQNDELDAEMQSYEAKKNPTYSGEQNQPLALENTAPVATESVAKADDFDAMFDDVLAEEVAKDEAKNAKPTNLKQAIAKHQAKRAPRTAAQSTVSAAKNTASALNNAIDGLGALFGGAGKLNSGLTFDAETYAKAKPLFQAAIADMGEAGKDLKEAMRAVIRMVMDKFGAQAAGNMKPYVMRFIEDRALENSENQADTSNKEPQNDLFTGTDTVAGSPGVQDGQSGQLQPDAGSVRRGNAKSNTGNASRGTDKNAPPDYVPVAGGLTREGSWFETAKRNIDLIELAIQIESEKRPATPAEQAKLSKYVGFGASAIRNDLFPIPPAYAKAQEPNRLIWPQYVRNDRFKPLAERIEALPREWQQSILQSSQYAHYTSEGIIRSVWSALGRMGFNGGQVFEPGMGIGSFAMLMPDAIRAESRYTGVEFDAPTALIAKLLSPQQNMLHGDFIKGKYPKNFFDVNVGNPPFAQTKIFGDPEYAKKGFMIHDFFFAKGIDLVRPGGIQVFVTSKGTMDKQTDKARKYLSERADLLGAIRLPSTAFEDNAGTSVVTDVIFLRKRLPGEAPAGESWANTATVETPDGPVVVNEYFSKHPEMVLGQQRISGNMDDQGRRINSNGMGGEKYTVVSYDATPAELEAKFAKAIEKLPEGAYSEKQGKTEKAKDARVDFDPSVKREGVVYLAKDGALMRVAEGVGVPLSNTTKLSDKDQAWFKSYVGLRDLVQDARFAQLNDGAWEAALAKLNKAYDKFVKEHGHVLDYRVMTRKSTDEEGNVVETESRIPKNRRLLREDYDQALVTSLESIAEDGSIVKSPFLKARTIGKPVSREVKSIGDALAVSLDETGHFDLADVGERLKLDEAETIEALGNQIFQTPAGEWQLTDEYLSGDVVAKLEEAEAAARINPDLKRNVDALKEAQPEKLGPAQISAKLGASWIPESHVNEFAKEIDAGAVTFDPRTETWQVDGGNKQTGRRAGAEYGTAKRSPSELLEAILNSRSIKITQTIDKKTVPDQEGTTAANEMAKKIKDKFRGWVWTDTERATELVESYNKNFNNIAPRKFDGSHLTLPGVSLRYKLHPHQLRAIWRMVQTGNTYLAHAVGAGKTIEMIAGGMEQKRLGLIKKPMYVVPNHMLEQFSNEFMELYPLANIMVADDENFSPERRKAFIASATLNNPDAIVITHDAFQRIGVKEESVAPIRDEIISDLEIELSETAKGNDTRVRRGQLEQQIEAVNQRFDRIVGAGSKDSTIKFEDMGVDFVFADEAHVFRKLDFHTAQQIKGIDPNGSKRALDMYVKTRILEQRKPGRSMVFASGTPVTNTMGELYTIMRFFAGAELDKSGISTFDAWARQFGEVAPALEPNAAGKYELIERFAKFDNVPELMSRVRQFMDVLTSDNLGALVKRPNIIGGKPNLNIIPTNSDLTDYMKGELASRIETSRAWKPSKDQPYNPDPIVAIITDGRFAAIDPRFFGGTLKEGDKSIITEMGDKVVASYHATKNDVYLDKDKNEEKIKGSTQIVFYNLGFGEQSQKSRGFNSRAAFTKRLTDGGIPRAEIAWFDDANSDAKKEAVFKAMRNGTIKVLIGSAKKMGTGVNVQKRLAVLHYQDPPWFPADVEQPHGRILRQGNQNEEIAIEWYTTKGTYQSTMWQMVGRKQRFIDQAFTGDKTLRSMDDLGEASLFEQAAAVASGDPRAIQLAGLKQDVERFTRLQAAHANEQINVRSSLNSALWQIESGQKTIRTLEKAFKAIGEKYFAFTSGRVSGRDYTKPGEFGQAIKDEFNKVAADSVMTEPVRDRTIASIGDAIKVTMDAYIGKGDKPDGTFDIYVEFGGSAYQFGNTAAMGADVDATGLARRIFNKINEVDSDLQRTRRSLAANETDAIKLRKKLGAPFEYQQEMAEKYGELKRLESELEAEGKATPAPATAAFVVKADGTANGEAPEASTNLAQTGASEGNTTDVVFGNASIRNGDADPVEAAKVQAGIEGKSLIDAARFIEQTGTPAQAEIAKQVVSKLERLQSSGVDLKLIVLHRGDQAPADMGTARGYTETGFDAKGRDITVWLGGADIASRVGTDYETVLHELVHAATMGVVNFGRSNPRSLAGKHVHDLSMVTSAISSHIVGRFEQADSGDIQLTEFEKDMREGANNAFRSIDEVLTWALTSPDAQTYLEAIPYKIQNLWTKLVQAIRTLLGLSPTADTALSEVLRVAENLMASDLNDHSMQAFWHKRGIRMGTIQAKDSIVMKGGDSYEQAPRSSIADTLASAANSARDVNLPAGYKVGDLFNSVPGKLNWWHKTVGTQYNLAQRSKPFKRVYDAVQNFMNDVSFYATESADKAPTILPKLENWRDIAKRPVSAVDTKAYSKPVFEGTLIWARDESGKLVKAEDLNSAGVVFTDSELKAEFNLTPEQISLYREFRSATDESLTNLAIADMIRFGGEDVKPIADQALGSKTVTEAADMLRDHLLSLASADPKRNEVLTDTANRMIDKGDKAKDLMDRGYAPLSRFGKYTLDVVDANGDRVYFGMFESAAEAAMMNRKMTGLYPGAKINQGTVSEQAYKLFAGVSPETLELFGDMLGLEAQGDKASAQAFQEYLKLAKSSRSAMKRLIQRKGIAGFSEDAGRVLAGFVYSNARQTATSLNMGEMAKSAADKEAFGNQGELQDAAVKLVDYIKTPQEEAQALRGLLFAQYIGGSVASAMVNMTQPITMTFPWLSQYGGAGKAAKQMTAAMKDSGKKTTGDAKLDAALHRAEEDGTVSPQEVHQLMQQSQGRGALQSGDGTRTGDALAKANNVLSKVGLAWGKLFGVAEQFNRRVTFIAAYRTAVAQGIADPDGFARKAIAETQGVYNKGNKPSWARGAVGSTLFTFKQYSIAYVEMLSRMAGNGPEGKKAALLALAVLFLLSGAGGMPGADDLDDVISGAMQSLGYNFDSKMKRKEFFVGLLGEGGAQFVERGVSGLPGVPIDVSGRMGLGNLIPGTGLFTKKADHTRDVAELAGPAGDFVKRGFDAAGKLITGDVGGAVDSVSPKAIQNLTQAYDMATRGMYRDAKGMKVLDTDGYDALAKAIGFQPNDVKRAQDANFEVTRMIGLNKINETDIANRWAMGVFEKDAAKIQEARDDLAEWNRANPESPIRIDFKQIRSRVQKMNETKAQRISKTAPREIRAAVRQELASAQ